MPDDTQSVDVSNPILGSLKVSGATVNTIFTVFGFVVTSLIAWVLWTHHADAKDLGRTVAQELKEANKEIAQTLKESQKDVKETNRDVSKALQDLAQAMREQNCLAQFPTPQERAQNAELCKRISR